MKKYIILVVLLIVVVGGYYFINKKAVPAVVVMPDTNTPAPAPASKEVCYFKETKSTQSTDDAFTSINYDANNKVHGIINWIPGEKDSLVGTYTGTVEASDVPGYPTRLNVVYAGAGEGIISYQQQIIIVGANDIKTGTGEMEKGSDGVSRIKDMSKLTYDNALPMVDCNNVLERFKKDYSKAS